MKWRIPFVIAGLVLLTGSTVSPSCNLAEFKYIAMITHYPPERKERVVAWLRTAGPACSKDQLVLIHDNMAMALGTSDDLETRAIVYQLYEAAK